MASTKILEAIKKIQVVNSIGLNSEGFVMVLSRLAAI
jgi:hypothetical protein